jgi:hypothetical protein
VTNIHDSWDALKAEASSVVNRVRGIVEEGNRSKVVIESKGREVAAFPLTAGVIGAVLAPELAVLGTAVTLLKECTVRIEPGFERKKTPDPQTSVA